MRILITVLLLCISAVVFAQVNTSFRGTLNIYQASGAGPNYEIRGIFNDTQGQYTSDSVDVGDVIFILEGSNCARLVVTNIISTTGGIIRADVTDSDAVLVNAPLGNAAILEETPNYGFPTFVDGISNDLLSCIQSHFALQVDDITSGSGGTSGTPGNTQDTVVQVAHGLSLLDPVFVNASGNWILSNISNEDSCHMAIVTEVISADTLILTYNGLTTQPAHGYTVGSVYFVQDDGTYATTVPTNFINDIAFYVVSDSTLYITEQRIVSPMTDLNGIYSTSDTIPDGTIATGDEFTFKGKTNPNYEFKFWPSNDNIYIKSDSVLLTFSSSEAVFRDYKSVPTGIEYNGSGYVTNPLSLTTKEYVDSLAASASVADGDKGDIVVSGSGTIWNIDTDAVGSNEIAADAVGASEIATGAVTSTEILDGTITTTDLAFTPNTGAGASGQVAVYTGTNTTTSYSTLTYNGTNTLTLNGGAGGTRFNFASGGHYFRHDPINTAGSIMIGASNRIMAIPVDGTSGVIIRPNADNETFGGVLRLSNGIGNLNNSPLLDIGTGQLLTSNGIHMSSLSIANTWVPDPTNDISNSSFGAINISSSWSATATANQKAEFMGIRLRPTINRNSTTNDNSYGIHIQPTLGGGATHDWYSIYNNISTGFFLADNAGASNYFQGNTLMGYSLNTTNYKLRVTRNNTNYPLFVSSPGNTKFLIKGTSNEDIFSSSSSYGAYPAIVGISGGVSAELQIGNIASTAQHTVGIFGGSSMGYTAASDNYGIVGYMGTQITPDVAYTSRGTAITAVAEHLLHTAENADTDFGGSSYSLYGIRSYTKMSQDWSNGVLDFYAGQFIGNGASTVGGANASNAYGIYTSASGATTSNWSIYSDEGNHYYEDDSKFGGSVATPTARVEIEGSGTTSATYGLQVENSSGANIVSVRDDRYVAFGATTGGSIVEMFTDASRKTYFDGFDILMYNRGSGQNQFGFFGGNGSLASPTNVAAGENLGEIAWYGYYNTADRYANVIRSKVDSVAGSTVWGRLEFNYGSSTPMVTMYGKNNLTQVHGRLGVTSRTGTATSIAGWSSGISTDVSVGYGLNLTSGALEVDTTLIGDGGGETNTASNLGAGAGVYEQKSSVDLQFNSLVSESTTALTIAEDDPNNTIDFTINTGAVANGAGTLTTGDQVYDFVTAQGNVYTKDDTISEDRIVTIAPDYLFKIRANDTYSSSGYFNFGTLNIDDRFGFDLYDANGTSSGRINSYYDIGSTGKNQLTIENVNSTELGRILMTHDGSEEQLTILNKNGADTTLIRMTALGTTIQDDTELNVNTPNFQFTGAGFDVIASTNSVFTTPATQFTGTLRVDTDGSTATSLVGQDVSNRLTNVSLGYGLDLTSGVLLVDSLEYATQYDLSLVSGTTNLTFSGASSPVTLNSSSGNDVTFTQGTGISLAATGTNITITNSGDTNAADDVTTAGGTSGQVPYFNGTNTITSELGLSWNSTNDGLSIISQALLGGRGLNVQQHSTDIGGAASVFVKSRGTFASQTAVVNGDIIGAFVFKGYSGTQYLSDNALFGASTTGTVTTTSVPTSLFFISGATSNYNPDLLIHSGGNVGIGSSGTGDITSTINTPPRQLTVYGETRITDLTTDTPTQVVGADADGDLGALALSGMSVVAGTLTATDASATNELQTITSSSDATSHTVTLSNTGGSIQLVEGSNITLTTSGTSADGVVTIASTGGGATDLTFTGASSPYTLNSSTGTDVTITEGEGIDILRSSNDLTISAPVMTAATGGGAGAVGIVPQPSAGENIEFLRGDATWAAVEYIKGATIETPGSSENVTLFYTRKAITIREVADVVRGTSPSVTWQIKYATTRDSGTPTDLFSASRTTTSTSGATTTTFNDATIGAGNWIWLVTSATSGTNDELSVQLTYTID